MTPVSDAPPLAHVRGSLRAVARAVIPSTADLDPEAWERFDAIVDDAVSERPVALRRQLVLFLRAVSVLSLVRFARPLARLDAERCRLLLRSLERSRILAVRRGLWGIRTLAFMGYYGQAPVQRALGYRAAPGGWKAREADDA